MGMVMWEVPTMTTVKLDSKRRATIAHGKPGQVMAVTENGDGSITLTPVKPDVKEAFPRGSLRKHVQEMNRQWDGVRLPVPSAADLPE